MTGDSRTMPAAHSFRRLQLALGASVASIIALGMLTSVLPLDHSGDFIGLALVLVVIGVTVWLWATYRRLDHAARSARHP